MTRDTLKAKSAPPAEARGRGEMETKWWVFKQNNSGGTFDHDPEAGIGYMVLIEARNTDEASARAQDIGIYFDGCRDGTDCPCCGDRWYEPYGDGDPVPNIYGQSVRAVEEGEDPWIYWGIPSYMHPLEGPFAAITKATAP